MNLKRLYPPRQMRRQLRASTVWNSLTLEAAALDTPITLSEAKQHCRVDFADDDALITGLIGAALSEMEGPNGAGLALMPQEWKLSLDCFPRVIEIPMMPVTGVTSIAYTDTDGVVQALDSSAYKVDIDSFPARITPAYGTSWPATRWETGAVKIVFGAGYANAAGVPDDLKAALKLIISHRYENRESVSAGTSFHEVPDTARGILDRYAVGRFSA